MIWTETTLSRNQVIQNAIYRVLCLHHYPVVYTKKINSRLLIHARWHGGTNECPNPVVSTWLMATADLSNYFQNVNICSSPRVVIWLKRNLSKMRESSIVSLLNEFNGCSFVTIAFTWINNKIVFSIVGRFGLTIFGSSIYVRMDTLNAHNKKISICFNMYDCCAAQFRMQRAKTEWRANHSLYFRTLSWLITPNTKK